MSNGTVAAVDLGATSGRVMLGHVGPNELRLEAVNRFPNTPVQMPDGLHWDIFGLYRSVLEGLGQAARLSPGLASIGIDSWAVDYGLLRGDRLLGTPFHYRDSRTTAGVTAVHDRIAFADLYAENGLQFLPFNTLYQFEAEKTHGLLALADQALLVPDLIAFWLSGARVAESTNASTTGLLSLPARRGEEPRWNDTLIARLGLPRQLFPPLVQPGERIGTLLPHVADATGLAAATPIVAVGSHDTASAVVAVPMTDPDAAFISCGTWGLVGVERDQPVLTEASRAANFTNEGGVDGRVRFLHNVMGTWLLSESVRTWQRVDPSISLLPLVAAAEAVSVPVAIFDANDPRFMEPGDIPARIVEWCVEHGRPVPTSPAEFVRSIIESLARAFASAVQTASELSGTTVRTIHIVGGGSQNALLCQLTADHAGIPVVAGPVEATALGNVLVQARAAGLVSGDLESLRGLVAASIQPLHYAPRRRT
ncbi:rhamnulokinase [Glaciibacter psychrotolerans]|uniref:Rhamnulokinase n=1 Tax=Glaciibacter psychrotolerans TaxID=670054 RepID=A0A7Z0J6X3_9MICO|nr:rhamnulokinase family protein [Leifsonia psychrotolerans]NYJ20870.1 rhamnulokinase [Leifsonia psychrotolerans]